MSIDYSKFNSIPVPGETADNSSPLTPPLVNNYRPNHNQIGDQQPVTSTLDQPMSPLSAHMSPVSQQPISPGSVSHHNHLSPVSQHGPISPANNQESMDVPMLPTQYDQMTNNNNNNNNNDPYHPYRRPTTVHTNNSTRDQIYQSPSQYRTDNMMLSPSQVIHSPQSNDVNNMQQVNDYSVDGMQKRQAEGHRTEYKLASSEFQASNSSRVNLKQEPSEGNF